MCAVSNNKPKHPFISLARTNAQYAEELREAAARVIDSGRYLHGHETEAFERDLALLCGVKQAIGVSNGLDALRLIVRAAIELGRLRPGDEVIYPANTYIASVLPLTEFGLKPVGLDPDAATFNLDMSILPDIITERTRAVMVVHLYGNPCWDSDAAKFMADRGIMIIEDNAQAIGARTDTPGLNGNYVTGGLGHVAAHSFYPTKNLGALGDAGAVTTDDTELADTIKALANYGSDRRYHNIYTGYNCRLDEIQAAMLRVKLRHLDEITSRRRTVARIYNNSINNPLVQTPAMMPGCVQVWHQYPVRSPKRDKLREWLDQCGIATDIHYAVPPHRQPCYADKGDSRLYPLTDRIASQLLSLPIADLNDKEAAEVAEAVNAFSL
ncbi:MAG: DegT/DnrJ/EryC1/StrS family aminotransferase [Muribaculaceae bacterium]|nr:DegT/DnrJ/EryC1/StrS family aminotransferase [Muribaculaceae bacterium]